MNALIKKAAKKLHAQGGRMTAQRKLILETLANHTGHPTAEELYQEANLKDPSLHLSTVYRTLRWLEQEDLIKPRLFKDDRLQERFDVGSPSEHDHFVCKSCKKVIEFDEAKVDEIKSRFETEFNAKVESAALVLYGLCMDCQNTE